MTYRLVIPIAAAVVLAACSTGRPKERINPPAVSIQEIHVDGTRCLVQLRVHNHSSVSMRFRDIRLDVLDVDGRDLAPLAFDAQREIPPYTGEPIRHELPCPSMTDNASELVYRLSGTVNTDQPYNRRFDVRHNSRLLPVPGLPATWR